MLKLPQNIGGTFTKNGMRHLNVKFEIVTGPWNGIEWDDGGKLGSKNKLILTSNSGSNTPGPGNLSL